jgi:hypothetical protein
VLLKRFRGELRLPALILPSRHLFRLVNVDGGRRSAASAAGIGALPRLVGEPPPAGDQRIQFFSRNLEDAIREGPDPDHRFLQPIVGLRLPASAEATSDCRERVVGHLQPVACHSSPSTQSAPREVILQERIARHPYGNARISRNRSAQSAARGNRSRAVRKEAQRP